MKQLMHDYIIFNVPVSLCVSWSTSTTTTTTYTKSNRESNYLYLNFISIVQKTAHSTKSLN